jgi:putative DNA primase/helicase
MPEWIENLMIKSSSTKKSANSKVDNNDNADMQDKKASKELSSFLANCPRLMEILEQQESCGNIDYTTWFNMLSFLIKADKKDLAYEFSALYHEEDTEATEKQIEEIEKNIDDMGFIRCSTFGCSNHFIKKCQGKVNKDENNSPIKILNSKSNVITDDVTGFAYEDGILKYVNFNIFSRHIHSLISVKRKSKDVYYLYSNKNYWERREEFDIKKVIRKVFNRIEPDSWRKKYVAECFEHFDADCKKTPTNNFDYINLANGLYDINTKELYEHDSDIFTTSQLPLEYDPEADCPNFKKFIDDVFGEKNHSLKKLVQEIAGYCLDTTTRAEKFFIFHGAGGNGKSKLCDVFLEILGKNNISAVPMDKFKDDFTRTQIVDKLANIVTENELKGLETAYAKTIASGDIIQINQKFVPTFNYKPFTKLIFSFNNMPYSADKSDGLERKLIIIPFKFKFVDNPTRPNQKKRDLFIDEKFLAEKSGILNWFIEGLERLRQQGYKFTKSKIAKEALNDYMRSVNVVMDFVNTNLEEAQGEKLTTEELQSAFINWCDLEGHKKIREIGITKFLKELRSALDKEEIPYSDSKSDGKQIFKGIMLKDSAKNLTQRKSYFDKKN